MGERDSYAPGTFCWADLGTTDADAAKAFYTRVFGWEAVDSPAPRVRELGGEVLAEPVDVAAAGRMAALRDPTGATLHLWQPREQLGAGRVNDPGCMCWNELASPDPARARDFFTELLGWTVEPEESGYGVIKLGEAINGGMRPLPDGEPTHWLVYFTVESLDEAVATIREAGGSIIAGPMVTPVGRVAAVGDPQGAAFALYEGQVDP